MSIYIFFSLGKQIAATFGSDDLRKKFFIFLALSLFLVFGSAGGQVRGNFNDPEYTADHIKTVLFHRSGSPMTYPVIALNSNQKLSLSFDELGTTVRDYYYSIEHCDSDWQPSTLMRTEYIRGNEILPVEDYRRSFNTTFDYVHYQLQFPNTDASVLLSGNYLIHVYEGYDAEEPVLSRRFMVSERKVNIEADIKYTMQSSGRGHFQEIDFEVLHSGTRIQDPGNEVRATVMQNGRTDNAITDLRPLFYGDDEMDFNYNRKVVMEGGNEFRWIDLRSLRFQSDHVADITFSDPFYHVEVYPDRPQKNEPYYYHRDFNGRYFIDVQEEQEPNVSADYAFVHFSLNWGPADDGKEVYLMGGMTNWQLDENNRMDYDDEREMYALTLLLKQGYYNYQYLVKEEGDPEGSVMPVEGSFGRTSNDYLILIYYRPAGERYDRLLGTGTFDSANR